MIQASAGTLVHVQAVAAPAGCGLSVWPLDWQARNRSPWSFVARKPHLHQQLAHRLFVECVPSLPSPSSSSAASTIDRRLVGEVLLRMEHLLGRGWDGGAERGVHRVEATQV